MSIKEILLKTGTLLEGHFVLSSGLHSDKYFQCARILQYPNEAEKICKPIAEHFRDKKPDIVLSPAIGAVIAGYEVARQLGIKNIFAERKTDIMELRRSFDIANNEKVLIVEDVITTGGSVKELVDIVKNKNGRLVGIACLINRSEKQVDFNTDMFHSFKTEIKVYPPDNCELCKSGIPVTKPGSKK